jgi:hypothetical protein
MPFQLPTLANLNPTAPNVANPVDQATKLASLKNMQSDTALRQQLAPLDVQEAQAKVQSSQQANTMQQIQLQTMQAQNKYWSAPETFATDPATAPGNDKVATMLGVAADDPILAMVHGQMKAGVPGMAAIQDAKATLEFRKSVDQATDEHQKVMFASIKQLQDLAAPVMAEKDPVKKAAMIEALKPQLAEITKGDPNVAGIIPKLNVQNFDAFTNRVGAEQAAVDYRTKSADVWKKELDNATTADPLLKMETNPSEAFSGDKLPASKAFLQTMAKSNDPQTAVRATKLLGMANSSQANELAIDKAKKAAEQAITDGDPKAAARLLVDGDTPPSMIISSRKPEFAEKALTEAKALAASEGKVWSPAKADADFTVAKSPAQVAFFGSAKSMTDPGGTIDQLKAIGKQLPQGELPVWNSIADIYKAQTGSGPVAHYAATLIGVADDYAKVTGGGQGTEGMQKFIMSLAPAKASPEARDGALEGFRDSVDSQVKSRIGNNSVLQNMYGQSNRGAPAGGGAGAGGHIIALGGKNYQYSGSGDTADMKNYTLVKAPS